MRILRRNHMSRLEPKLPGQRARRGHRVAGLRQHRFHRRPKDHTCGLRAARCPRDSARPAVFARSHLVGRDMKLTTKPGNVEALAEEAVVAVCALADAAGPERCSASAVEDAATALEVLAGALSEISPEAG